jgi:hypothetical protein
MAEFIDCTSLNISFDVMGRATVSYTIVHNAPRFTVVNTINVGGETFRGYVVNASMNPIPKAAGWYETHVTLIATT